MHACNNFSEKEMHIWHATMVLFSLILAHIFEEHLILLDYLQGTFQNSHQRFI